MKKNQELYKCPICGWTMPQDTQHYVDHCPNCLSGIHHTDSDGCECGGILEPVGIWVKESDRGEIVLRCRFCGEMTSVTFTEADSRIKALSIASKPLSSPPFPIERLEELTKIMGGSGKLPIK